MVTEFIDEVSDLEIVESMLPRLSPETLKTLRVLAEQLLRRDEAKTP